jgi:hypothetical protein
MTDYGRFMRPRQRTAPDDGVVRTKRARQAVLKRVRLQTGLTHAGLAELQGGRCAVCGRDDVALHVDHSRRTGKTRGLLCRQCNCALGMLGDSPMRLRAALRYLLRPPALVTLGGRP